MLRVLHYIGDPKGGTLWLENYPKETPKKILNGHETPDPYGRSGWATNEINRLGFRV